MNYRETGILLPISSLPSKYGIGTMGKAAYEFIDFLNESGAKMWQILPLNVTSYGNSPYQSPSNYGLNYNFIDLDLLIKQKLLTKEEVESIDWLDEESRINYGKIFNKKLKVLRLAYSRFDKANKRFQRFANENEQLKDFSIFMVLKDLNNLRPWYEWDDEYRIYSKEIENKIYEEHKEEFMFYMWTQFEFINEYSKLKKYANKKGIKIMGDLPIYVAFDSVEVWKYPELFELDENHYPINVAGCPPDCFSVDGQLWGNPLYNWEYHKESGYKWWNSRISNALNLFDLVRIDHFRGFSAYYSIPFGDKTAKNGRWVKGPGIDLFKDKLDLNIIAEDLGMVDEEFEKLMKETGYPGMKIVTQCFENDDPTNIWRPSNYGENFFSYTGTHDSQTTKQFIDESTNKGKALINKVIEEECIALHIPYKEGMDNKELTLKIVELNIASKAKMAVIPIMDLYAIGKEGRINFPSKLSDDNRSWRLTKELFDSKKHKIAENLKVFIEKYNRR